MVETAQVLGNVGEFVGAIAVVATLLYLAVQLKHGKEALDANTRTAKGSLSYQAARNRAESNARWIENPELLDLTSKAAQSEPLQFTHAEERRLSIANRMIMEGLDADCYLYRHGLLDEEFWQIRLELTKRRLARPYLADWWERERVTSNYSPTFLEELDRHLASGIAIETWPETDPPAK